MPFMSTNVTIDRVGRVVIPKLLRDELRLEAGDTLALESDGERMTLRHFKRVGGEAARRVREP
jgi:AbrB family looped-hinge helix DNA binding protein